MRHANIYVELFIFNDIEEWFKKNDTSPKTGEILKSKGLIPNISIRNAIEEWKKRNSQ